MALIPPSSRTPDAPASTAEARKRRAARSHIRLVTPPDDDPLTTSRRRGRARSSTRSTTPAGPASLDPSTYGPEHDVVHELTYNRDAYTGREWISIYGFPTHMLASINALREQVTEPSRPGLSPTIACCLARGIALISSDESVVGTLDTRRRLIAFRNTDGLSQPVRDELDELTDFFGTFPLTVPLSSTRGERRQNVSAPDHLQSALSDLASDLGTSVSSLAVLCVALALSEQSPMIATDRIDEYIETQSRFFRRAQMRLRIVRTWLAQIESGCGWSDPSRDTNEIDSDSNDSDDHD